MKKSTHPKCEMPVQQNGEICECGRPARFRLANDYVRGRMKLCPDHTKQFPKTNLRPLLQ